MNSTFITRKYENVVDEIIPIPDNAVYIVSTAATTTADVQYTLEEHLVATQESIIGTITFADANPDTITRTGGDWLYDGFVAGMTLTVANSTLNDGDYLIVDVTDKTIVLDAGDALTAETIDEQDASLLITGLYDDASIWFTEVQVVANSHSYVALDTAPTGIRVLRTAGTTVTVWVKT